MFEQLNAQINRLQENYTNPENIAKRLKKHKDLLQTARYELDRLKVQLEKENLDVEKIKQMNLKTLFYKMLGSHDKQLDKEKEEALRAQLRYEECEKHIEELSNRVSELTEAHYEALQVQKKIEELLSEKRELIKNTHSQVGSEILKLTQQIEERKREVQEIKEAISPGNAAAIALHDALDCLESAGDWGTLDLLGVDLISDIMKHSKIDDTKKHIFEAQRYLAAFQVELKDVEMDCEVLINVGQGATFADFFFDGLIADWYMQSKIGQSRENILQVYERVSQVVESLREELRCKEGGITQLEEQIEMLIYQAK